MVVDRATGRIALIVSTEGGMDIETVAHDTPEKITSIIIDPAQGFMPHHGRAVAFALKLSGSLNKQAQVVSKQLYDAFVALDCEMLEINPLVETKTGELLVLDTKMSFDSNALYRHPDVVALAPFRSTNPGRAGWVDATGNRRRPNACVPTSRPRMRSAMRPAPADARRAGVPPLRPACPARCAG